MKSKWFSGACVVLYFGIILYQIYNMIVIGPLHYMLNSGQGFAMVMELILFGGAIAINNFLIRDNAKIIVNGILLLILSYLHQTLLPVFIVSAYFCLLALPGYLFSKLLFGKKKIKNSVMLVSSIIFGVHFEIFSVFLLSCLKLYSVKRVYYILFVFSVISIIVCHRNLYEMVRNRKPIQWNVDNSLFCTFLEILILIQVGRVGIQGEFDAFWYGLRSGSVLANSGSGILKNFNFAGLVYLYPKGYETLLLPLTKFSSWNYQFLFNVGLSLVIVVLCWCFIKELANKKIAYILTPVIMTIPSLNSMAVTVKPDVITALYQIAAVYTMYLFSKNKDSRYLFLSGMCLLSSYSYKITSLLFTSAIVIALLPFIKFKKEYFSIRNIIVLLSGFITTALMCLRTYIIAGTPLIVYVGKIFGITAKYPYTINDSFHGDVNSNGTVLDKLFDNIYAYFINPTGADYAHVIIAWGTSLPILILFIAIFMWIKRRAKSKWIWFMTVMLATLLVGMLLIGQADGNYFLVFYILFILLGGSYVLLCDKKMKYLMYLAIIFNFIITACSNWSHKSGFTDIRMLNRGAVNQVQEKDQKFKKAHGKKIFRIINNKNARILAVTYDVEELVSIKGEAQMWWDLYFNEPLSSIDSLYKYLTYSDFDYIYLDKNSVSTNSDEVNSLKMLINMGAVKKIIYGKNAAMLAVQPQLSDSVDEKLIEEFNEFVEEE